MIEMTTRDEKSAKFKIGSIRSGFFYIEIKMLRPKEIWFLYCEKNKEKNFGSFLDRTFNLSLPEECAMIDEGDMSIIHAPGTFYIIKIRTGGLSEKVIKGLSRFGRTHNSLGGLINFSIKGRGVNQLINRLVSIDAERMKTGESHVIPISFDKGYLCKKKTGSYELIIPSSYVTHFMESMEAIVCKLENLKKSEIILDRLFLKLRN